MTYVCNNSILAKRKFKKCKKTTDNNLSETIDSVIRSVTEQCASSYTEDSIDKTIENIIRNVCHPSTIANVASGK